MGETEVLRWEMAVSGISVKGVEEPVIATPVRKCNAEVLEVVGVSKEVDIIDVWVGGVFDTLDNAT